MPAADPVTRLFINGIAVTTERARGDVVLTRTLLHNLDGPDEIEFTEYGATSPTYKFGDRVQLKVAFDGDEDGSIAESDYVLRFAGQIMEAPISFGTFGPQIDYRCAGLKFLANDVPVIHPQSGKTEVAFNLDPTDTAYDEDLAILPLGEILRRVLTYDDHATQLWYQGITAYTADPPPIDPDDLSLGYAYDTETDNAAVLKTATLDDLAAMTTIPREIRLAGSRLWQQIENVIEDNVPYRGVEIQADGTIRFHDTRSPNWLELSLGDPDTPLMLPALSADASQCYGAVKIIGSDEVEGEAFETQAATLVADWTGADQAAWKWSDFAVKENGDSKGTITALGPTTVTVKPTSGALSWVANRWSTDKATIEVILPIGPSNPSTLKENRRIIGCTACPVNGTSVISLEYPLAQTGYTEFKITGQSTNPLRFVWRRYKFADPDKAERVVDQFPFEVLWEMRTGTQYVRTPVGKNYRQADGTTGDPFETDLFFSLFTDTDGLRKVLVNEPTVKPWTAQADLDTGGASVKAPTNILVFVPISRGLLVARYPSAGFSGVGAERHGLKRTRYVPMDDWLFRGDLARMQELAQTIHDTVKDPATSGTLTYLGLWRSGVVDVNVAVKLTSTYGTTPWEADYLHVRAVEVAWPVAGAVNHETRLRVSNQRRAWAGDRQYTPASFVEGGPLSGAADLDARTGA